MVDNVDVGTEAYQQHVLDAFLTGIVGTAQDHLATNIKIDRNARESSMTRPKCRPNYIFSVNGQLVFKGEERRTGSLGEGALDLCKEMLPGSVGKTGKLDSWLGYASSCGCVRFYYILGVEKMIECSDIINLQNLEDRVTMIITLVNVVRITQAQILAKGK
ncbi:hypothetical protein GGI19_002020 [Coemansia pectinata]|uniref:Uncharacterized protein n=1 Tax=Coemansia pectinata TaxID=1052879 RepID=A0A9W8LBM8_9FUNG|nr:hypothetical protein GGI19_002020 [Coemansia pectinata]